MVKPQATMKVGIVVERRKSDHPWQDHSWRLVEVVPGGLDLTCGDAMAEGDGWAHFFAGNHTIELFRRETAGYKTNLAGTSPVFYVVMRESLDDGPLDRVPFLATVCAFEGLGYQESGDDEVWTLAMPGEIAVWLQAFCDEHHVEQIFIKRKQKSKNAERPPHGH